MRHCTVNCANSEISFNLTLVKSSTCQEGKTIVQQSRDLGRNRESPLLLLETQLQLLYICRDIYRILSNPPLRISLSSLSLSLSPLIIVIMQLNLISIGRYYSTKGFITRKREWEEQSFRNWQLNLRAHAGLKELLWHCTIGNIIIFFLSLVWMVEKCYVQ